MVTGSDYTINQELMVPIDVFVDFVPLLELINQGQIDGAVYDAILGAASRAIPY